MVQAQKITISRKSIQAVWLRSITKEDSWQIELTDQECDAVSDDELAERHYDEIADVIAEGSDRSGTIDVNGKDIDWVLTMDIDAWEKFNSSDEHGKTISEEIREDDCLTGYFGQDTDECLLYDGSKYYSASYKGLIATLRGKDLTVEEIDAPDLNGDNSGLNSDNLAEIKQITLAEAEKLWGEPLSAILV